MYAHIPMYVYILYTCTNICEYVQHLCVYIITNNTFILNYNFTRMKKCPSPGYEPESLIHSYWGGLGSQ